jgi:pyridoxamine 5'-phosphate oxidase
MTIKRHDDPIDHFKAWFEDARKSEPDDPTAMALATADAEGRPSLRMVLLKDVSPEGFVFYTNLGSRKGRELAANPNAALCFHWASLGRQVRVSGPVAQVSDAEADEYFASRGRGSQIGAWASRQSQAMEGRFALEAEVARMAAKFGIGKVPRPDFWSGFRVTPLRVEFWQHRDSRLHDRLVYHRDSDGWRTEVLFP